MVLSLENQSTSLLVGNRTTHSPANWDQIETQDEVTHTLEVIQSAIRFDVYKHPDLYNLAYPGYKGDNEYYIEKGKEGSVLYLGVGTGRLFVPLAHLNPNLVGLDISPEMLKLLRQNNPEIVENQILEADARTFDLGENTFDRVVAPYSFLQCFDEEDMLKLFRNVYRALKPEGTFHTDTFSPFLIPFRKKGLETSIRLVAESTRVAIYVTYNHVLQTMQELAFISKNNAPDQVLEMNMYYYFPHEVVDALRMAGFKETNVIGDYTNESFDSTEHEIVTYEARKSPKVNGHKPNFLSRIESFVK